MEVNSRFIVSIFMTLYLSNLAVAISSFPRFNYLSKSVADANEIKASGTIKSIVGYVWYAGSPEEYIVDIQIGQKSLDFTFDCTTQDLSKAEELTDIKFCFKETSGSNPATCETLNAANTVTTTKPLKDVSVKFDFNSLNGGKAYMKNVQPSADVSSEFYCSVTNRFGTITSNKITLTDSRYQFKDNTSNSEMSIDPNKPLLLKGFVNPPKNCHSRVKWYSLSEANIQSSRNVLQGGSYQVLSNCSLYIPYFTSNVMSTLTERYIGAIADATIGYIYQYPVMFTTKEITASTQAVSIFYPPKFKPVKLKNGENSYIFFCNYRGGNGDAKVEWYKKAGSDRHLVGNTPPVMGGPNNGIVFKGPFTQDTIGIYICEVDYKVQSSYNVSIDFLPRVSKDVISPIYVYNGRNGTFKCAFDSIGVNDITASLGINGASLDLQDANTLKASVNEMNTNFNEVLGPLKVDVSPLAPKASESLTYTAIDMTPKSIMNGLSTSHMVQCIGTNNQGSVRKNVLLKAVPALLFSSVPSSTNCSSCFAEKEHVFSCVIANPQEYNTTNMNITVTQVWKMGGVTVGKINNFARISDDLSTLTLLKSTSKEAMDQINKDYADISCVVSLSDPNAPDNIFFSTSDDPELQARLSTHIQLILASPIAKANLTWVIALGLSIFVLIAVIVLVVAWFKRRPPAETYNVDMTEKQQGHDPETENAEKQSFPMYERAEERPMQGSRASLDESINYGSDDEDLAEYDGDIGHFNERASFIGEYDDTKANNNKQNTSSVV